MTFKWRTKQKADDKCNILTPFVVTSLQWNQGKQEKWISSEEDIIELTKTGDKRNREWINWMWKMANQKSLTITKSCGCRCQSGLRTQNDKFQYFWYISLQLFIILFSYFILQLLHQYSKICITSLYLSSYKVRILF